MMQRAGSVPFFDAKKGPIMPMMTMQNKKASMYVGLSLGHLEKPTAYGPRAIEQTFFYLELGLVAPEETFHSKCQRDKFNSPIDDIQKYS